MPSIHPDLDTFLKRRSEAIRAKDIDRLMSFYAADVVYFDIVPPLRYVGQAALRARFLDWFGRYESGSARISTSCGFRRARTSRSRPCSSARAAR